jgi:hypothetical protein
MPETQSNFEAMVIYEFGLFCKVNANGKSGYALIDTGATNSGITPKLAQDLTPVKQSTTGGAHGEAHTNIYSLPSLELLGQAFQDVRVSEAQAYEGFPGEILMRLGIPQLLSKPIVFDFKQLKFGFLDNLELQKLHQPKTYFVHGLPFFEIIRHNKPLQTLFDTGAGMTVLNSAHLEELRIELSAANTFKLPINDVNGQIVEQSIVVVDGLECAGHKLPASECILMDFTFVEKMLGQRIDLVLGANTMLRAGWVWAIDGKQNSLGFITQGILGT